MNVVGRVGSYLSQSVYSVATPFHPFGGAVDIIVVQQQDGSFRSTPWYVRFGKFQGVLKGAEKVVRIEVNGVEADFHMFLDNSGEAYFIKEIGLGKDGEETSEVYDSNNVDSREDPSVDYSNNVGKKESVSFQRNDSNASSNVEVQLNDDSVESIESDRYYEFPDDQSSFDDSLDLPDYGSNRYENSDGVEHLAESQSLKSEVVLVTVDGHVLTAPITSSEGHSENVQLSTPQFHLGPVDGPDLVEDEAAWDADYLSDLSTPKVKSNNVCHMKSNNIEACGRGGESVLKVQESHSVVNLERELSMRSNAEDSPCSVKKEDIFKSCMELHELAMREDHEGLEVAVDNSQENSPQTRVLAHETECGCPDLGVKDSQESSPQSCVLAHETERGCPDVGVKDSQENSPQTCVLAHESERGCPDVSVKDSRENSPGALLDLGKTEDGSSQSDIKISQENSPQTFLIGGETEQGSCEVEIDHSLENSPQGLLIADESENRGWEVDHAQENSPQTPLVASETEDAGVHVSEVSDTFSFPMSESPIIITSPDVQVEPQHTAAPLFESNASSRATGDECTISTTDERETHSNDDKKSDERIRIEISLCKNLFRPGMGSNAAAEIFEKHQISEEEFRRSAASIIKNDILVVRYKDRYLTWDKAAPIVLGMAAYGVDMPVEPDDSIPVGTDETPKFTRIPSGRRWRLWPIPFRRVKTLEHATSNSSNEEVFVDPESGTQNQMAETTARSGGGSHSPHKQLVRTNVPTTEQIASLNLKDGQNMVSFVFSTRVLGVQKVEAHIYLWKWNARIVISDVDGTITKSDVLGQFMPLVGKDWTQSGVARLFSAIKENGYQLLFLSARAIVQAYLTRSFLLNLKQDGKALPNGPVVISPDGLFPSLFREVIRRAPHEFKIACLEDIKALFPSDYNPFYAGFGNRDTDELSYRKMGIPKGKIFIINPKGEVAISHRIDVKEKSYTSLHTLVNDMFPPTSMIEQEDYNSWNYWRMPLPDVDL